MKGKHYIVFPYVKKTYGMFLLVCIKMNTVIISFGLLLPWHVCPIYACLHRSTFCKLTYAWFWIHYFSSYSFKWASYYSAGQIHFLVWDYNKIKVWGAIDWGNPWIFFIILYNAIDTNTTFLLAGAYTWPNYTKCCICTVIPKVAWEIRAVLQFCILIFV